jgi:hypothetical protein
MEIIDTNIAVIGAGGDWQRGFDYRTVQMVTLRQASWAVGILTGTGHHLGYRHGNH